MYDISNHCYLYPLHEQTGNNRSMKLIKTTKCNGLSVKAVNHMLNSDEILYLRSVEPVITIRET